MRECATISVRKIHTCRPYTAAIMAREMIGIAALPKATVTIKYMSWTNVLLRICTLRKMQYNSRIQQSPAESAKRHVSTHLD